MITIFSPGPQHARTKQTPEGVVLVSGKLGSRDAKYSAVDIAMVPRPISRTAWDFWDSIGRPRFVCAPMVEQSELAFRMLCRLGSDIRFLSCQSTAANDATAAVTERRSRIHQCSTVAYFWRMPVLLPITKSCQPCTYFLRAGCNAPDSHP